MLRRHWPIPRAAASLMLVALFASACAPAAPPSPTAAPAKPPQPTAAPKAETKPAPTAAPAKPAPTAAPAKPAATQPPAAKAAEKPAPKAADTFYAGKTVRMIIGYSTGGNYDVWARLIARHMPKHLPGNPTMIAENMPGAGSMVAANHLFNSAPKDGTVLATFGPGNLGNQILGVNGIEYDMPRFNWLGAISEPSTVCVATEASGATTFEDLLPPKRLRMNWGTTGPGSVSNDFPTLFNALLDTNINIVPGYGGHGPVRIAIESGELDGYCLVWGAAKAQHRPWIQAGTPKFQNLVQIGLQDNPDLPGVPNAFSFLKNDEDRGVMKLLVGQIEFFFPYAAPPGLPAERVALLRKALADTFKDPELIAEAQKATLETIPLTGERVEQLQKELLATPEPIKQRFKQLLGTR